MIFLIFSFELMINRQSPHLSTTPVDTEATVTALSLFSLVVPFVDLFTASPVVPCGPIKFAFVKEGDPGVASSFLSFEVSLEDAEQFEPVRRLWPPISLMNTFTSPVGADLHRLTDIFSSVDVTQIESYSSGESKMC